MRNGIITPKDGDTLLEIYHTFDLYGHQIRPLTLEAQVLIFAIRKAIQEGTIVSVNGVDMEGGRKCGNDTV